MRFIENDGGRFAAGFKGETGDCVTRAIAIATGCPYRTVYNDLFTLAKKMKVKNPSPRNGMPKKVYHKYLTEECGAVWEAYMKIGTGCTIHLKPEELPQGRIICRLSRHLSAVVDRTIMDTYDPGEDRCVYGVYHVPHKYGDYDHAPKPKPNKPSRTPKKIALELLEEMGVDSEDNVHVLGGGQIEVFAPDGSHWADGTVTVLVCFGWGDVIDRISEGLEPCNWETCGGTGDH